MGFSAVDSASGILQTGQSPVNLDSIQSYNFLIDGASSGIMDVKSGNGFTFSLPITEDSLSVEHYVPLSVEHVSFTVDQPLSSLHIRVVDDDNKPIVMQHDWFLVIERE